MADQPDIILSARQIDKFYNGRQVLDKVSFDVRRGEIFVILGGSGCGKSTMLRIMAGGVEPTSGQVYFNGRDMSSVKGEEREKIRRCFGMSFQSAALLDFLNVEENVSLPIKEHTKLDPHIISIMAQTKLNLVGLGGFEKFMPNELSGGMRKRAGLARAIAMDPQIVFYDEPTAGLDPVVCAVVDRLIVDLTKKLQITSIVVTHNMESVFRIADRVAMLYQGRLLQVGTAQEIKDSADPVIRQFIRGDIEGPIQMS
ncbi:MAG: ATP-binding cassette domain-containing protein [Candidatus Omnitrophica bacterium]|nr:ATP-binding cassette domain-containing protein [Candidatus Omnitrophota bacterium]